MSSYAYTIGASDPAISANEIAALKEWADLLPAAPRIVNIGAEHGISTVALLEVRPQALIYSVDINECLSEFENIRAAGLSDYHVHRILGRSQDIDPQPYAPLDLLFVDGDHHYESVKRDIEIWTPIVKAGGLVVFHDYIEPPIPLRIKSRVYQAVNEWLANQSNLKYLSRTGSIIGFEVLSCVNP